MIRYRKPDNASAEMNIGRANVATLEMARDRAKKHSAQVPDGHDPIEAMAPSRHRSAQQENGNP
ncbi:integrase arm-type DNA-binding domain-containing protein [Hyphomonas sp.]|uniref:integrase arm-type DNA-binding domain-containing protein n=1 Tax=Hyphomonas sp. TaxID=87 RepID=UPI0039E545C7